MTINSVPGVSSDITEMLSKIRDISSKTKAFSETGATVAPKESFGDVMSLAKSAVTNVNDTQASAEKIKNAFIAGDSHVSMSQVVVETQKSKLAFEGLLAVRNKILDAYREIMNMTV